jgi:predicted transcriptional regulator
MRGKRSGAGKVRTVRLRLAEELYRRLRREAAAVRRSTTVVARQAIEVWLRARRRAAVYRAISKYAAAMAGTGADLDPALEAASLEHLAEEQRRARRHRR